VRLIQPCYTLGSQVVSFAYNAMLNGTSGASRVIGFQAFSETYNIINFVSDFSIKFNDLGIGTAHL
jgi:hypothetical protein